MNRVEFKFKVQELTPETTPLEILFEIAQRARDLVLSGAESKGINVNPMDCVSLLRVQKGSCAAVLSIPEQLASCVPEILTSIHDNNLNALPKEVVEKVKSLDVFAKDKHFTFVFPRNKKIGFPQATLGLGRVLQFPAFEEVAPVNPTGDTVVYGKLIRIGGEPPKAEILIPGEKKVSADLSRDLARKLACRLYDTVGLAGKAEWNKDTLGLERLSLDAILDYVDSSVEDAFRVLSDAVGHDWDGIDALEYVKGMREEP